MCGWCVQVLGVPFEGICRWGIPGGLWAGFLMASKKWLVWSLSLWGPQSPGCPPSPSSVHPHYRVHLSVLDGTRKMWASNSFSQRWRRQGLLIGFHFLSLEKWQAQQVSLGRACYRRGRMRWVNWNCPSYPLQYIHSQIFYSPVVCWNTSAGLPDFHKGTVIHGCPNWCFCGEGVRNFLLCDFANVTP